MQEENDHSKHLLTSETFWRNNFDWLQQHGYELRPRYRPDWVPSWLSDPNNSNKSDAEDYWPAGHWSTLDATRISDGKMVTLKKIKVSEHPDEVEIALFLSSPELLSDPRNHCVPIYEVLSRQEDPDVQVLVMPALLELSSPKFDTCGELVECFRQLIEGLQFMHNLNVSHGDCNDMNIMMDAMQLYPRGYHPARTGRERDGKNWVEPLTRTQKPTKYFYVDFGLSHRFASVEARHKRLPIRGGDKSVPEFKDGGDRIPQEPFATDVYYLGSAMKGIIQGADLFPGYNGLGFMDELIANMTNDDPRKRPTMAVVSERFDKILHSLSSWKLRSRAQRRDEIFLETPFRAIPYWSRRIKLVLTRTPALPRYSS